MQRDRRLYWIVSVCFSRSNFSQVNGATSFGYSQLAAFWLMRDGFQPCFEVLFLKRLAKGGSSRQKTCSETHQGIDTMLTNLDCGRCDMFKCCRLKYICTVNVEPCLMYLGEVNHSCVFNLSAQTSLLDAGPQHCCNGMYQSCQRHDMGILVFSASASYHIISYHIISYHIISYHIISYHIISYHIISYHIISYHIISYHIISYHIISYHIISYHIISYHIISYHIISYHIISYHIISYHIISYHIISYHIISYHIISYHIISYHIISYHIIA